MGPSWTGSPLVCITARTGDTDISGSHAATMRGAIHHQGITAAHEPPSTSGLAPESRGSETLPAEASSQHERRPSPDPKERVPWSRWGFGVSCTALRSVYIYVYRHTHRHIGTHTYMHIYTYSDIHMHVHVRVHICRHVRVLRYLCVSSYIHICSYVHLCRPTCTSTVVYVYVYTYRKRV